jgi:hypothetical protein
MHQRKQGKRRSPLALMRRGGCTAVKKHQTVLILPMFSGCFRWLFDGPDFSDVWC